jgi:hypothetical protein
MADEIDAYARDIKTKEFTRTSSKKSLRIILFREQREQLEENEYEKNALIHTHRKGVWLLKT